MLKPEKIVKNSDGTLSVPSCPVIPFIEGDGTGPDIWRAANTVIDRAVESTYNGKREISWFEVYAGEKAYEKTGQWMPNDTLKQLDSIRLP